MTSRDSGGATLVFGHRGVSTRAPENTIAAFRLIRDMHVPAVELDVHQCSTGELVVAHDDDLVRLAGASLALKESPLEAIREHDVGSWFGPDFAGEKVPTLDEVFELLGRDVLYDIEVKPYGTRLGRARPGGPEATLHALISRYGLEDRCIVSSFDPLVINRFTGVSRTVPTALIYSGSKELPFVVRGGRGRLFSRPTHLKPHFNLASPGLVRRLTAQGRMVIPWTVDDPVEAVRLAGLGVHGIISNSPDVIMKALEEAGR